VHEKVLERGVKVTGATVHYVERRHGQRTDHPAEGRGDPKDGDTPETLQRRVMEQAEWIILPQAIELIAEGRGSSPADRDHGLIRSTEGRR
jgi:phosphoribosylglycinamide formyltransferase-1